MKIAPSAILALLLLAPALPAASHTWKGTGISTLWSYAPNWTSGVAPTAAESSVTLIFPATAFTGSVDDITGLTVDTLNVNGPDYIFSGLGGAQLKLGSGGIQTNAGLAKLTTISANLPVALTSPITPIVLNSGDLTILSTVSGASAVIRSGFGYFTLGGTTANTFSGGLYCRTGSTVLAKADGIAAMGGGSGISLDLGDPDLVHNAYLRVDGSNNIPDAIPVSIGTRGTLTLSDGVAEKIGSLTLSDATVEVGTTAPATLTLGGEVSAPNHNSSSFFKGPGILNLGGTLRSFNCTGHIYLICRVADGAGGPGGIDKTGSGILALQNINTFTGPVDIHEGDAWAQGSACLGSAAAGTSVSAGATLQIQAGSIIPEPLTLQGTLIAYGMDNRWTGPVQVPFVGTLNMPYANSSLTLSGVISGNGSLLLTGTESAVVQFSGSQANTLAGSVVVKSGNLLLNKTLVSAINGALTIASDHPDVPAVVRYLQPHQLADAAVVTLGDSLLNELNFDGNSDTIGSLTGGGSVKLGSATLTTGGNNNTTEFHGVITGTASGGLTKNGTGTFTINPAPIAGQSSASSSYTGNTEINNGTLLVNDSQTGSFQVNGGFLGGSGSTGPIVLFASGHLCLCTLTTQNITNLGATTEIRADLTSPNNIQHITMAGALSLNNTTLKASLFYQPQFGTEIILIANDGVDPVQGNFLGLPNGSNFTISGKPFTIFYNGGDGNDVSVIYKGPSPVPIKILSMNYNPVTNTVNLLGLGDPGQVYYWQRSLDLITWTQAGTATANVLGVINGDFVNGLFKPDRLFYRLVLP